MDYASYSVTIHYMKAVDLTNNRYGKLTAIRPLEVKRPPTRCVIWLCSCECGRYKEVPSAYLKTGTTRSCGCLGYKSSNIVTPLFDDKDADLKKQVWLKSNGYAFSKGVPAHRIVLERKIGRPLVKGELCDHINRDRLDNRRSNLRLADRSLNSINSKTRRDNSSGYKGVYLRYPKQCKENGWRKVWYFVINRKGKKTYVSKGFPTPLLAYKARESTIKSLGY